MPNTIKSKLRTIVTFSSASFKAVDVENKPRFRGTFGDDLAIWLMLEMEANGVDVSPGLNQGAAGWNFVFHIDGRAYAATVLLHNPIGPVWLITLERDVEGALAWLGGRRRGVRPEAAAAVHSVLSASDKAASVWWYSEQDLRAGREGKGSPAPWAG
jgi:hypothetical protein